MQVTLHISAPSTYPLGAPAPTRVWLEGIPNSLPKNSISYVDVILHATGARVTPMSLRLSIPPVPEEKAEFMVTALRAGEVHLGAVVGVQGDPCARLELTVPVAPAR